MCPTLQVLPEDLLVQHCRFPTSPRRDSENPFYEFVTVSDDNTVLPGLEKSSEHSTNLVSAAWAILLRAYMRNDTVTFAVLSDDQICCCYQSNSSGKTLGADAAVSVLQFQFADECQLKDIRATARWNSVRQVLKTTHINTALNLSTPSSAITRTRSTDLARPTNYHPFDLILNLNATQSPVNISISYQWPIISESYAHAVANTFRKIVNELALHNESKVGDIDFVSEEDKQRMVSWNPKVPYAEMKCMHHLVAVTARAIPRSEAVCAWDGSLTYAQLDDFSAAAAKLLMQAGVGPGMFVPFAYEKSLWTVVATLGILKAGGAFVPLDPMQPRARLEETLNSLHASVVVTSDCFASTFLGLVDRVVIVSATTVSIHQHNGVHDSTSIHTKPSDPIFVLFTSGSTGRPKGIVHEHGAICTHAITHGEAMGYQGARVLQFAAHTFDVAIIDIFTTLLFGGVICIPSEEDRRSDIVGVINSMKADYAILTPSFAGLLEPSKVRTLRTLAIGGEALPEGHIERWAGDVSLIQIYGPAEVGICLIMPMHSTQTLPETVGHTLRNSSCWLVEPDNPHRLVPIGAVGELLVAGPSLARGYLNDDAKTRSSFLEDLSWAHDLELECRRFYRTGDLLKYNTGSFDGSYDFVGRKDSQIKLRGQRVEPGEVEHFTTRIPGVVASVIARPNRGCFAGELVAVVQMRSAESNASQILNGPISLASDQSLSVRSLREHLSRNLPGYMIPTACLTITRMPFVPSLKIDRRLVIEWLVNMESRPSKVVDTTMLDLKASTLDTNEVTANVLSLKVTEIVAGKDRVKRQMLENHDFGLQQAGIDSIQIISLSMFLQKRYEVKVPMHVLLSSKVTIRKLASLVDCYNQPSMTFKEPAPVDVRRESDYLSEALFRDIGAQSSNGCLIKHFQIRNIFLTGASGYLGSAILENLMARPDVLVFALVRCLTESAGLERIIDTAVKTGWWRDTFRSRIQVWVGDFTEPSLGLGSQQLQYLRGMGGQESHNIHAIIHNGARVHYSSDYETLKPPNVSSTIELLKFAALAPTISAFIFVSGGQKPNHLIPAPAASSTPSLLPLTPVPIDGYALSKAVSEHVVRTCGSHISFQNTRLCIVKPGYIIGSLASGIANTRDFIWRLVAACVEIGAYNADESAHWLFIADVSRVARSIVAAVFEPRAPGHVECVLDGLLFGELWGLLRDGFGYALEPVGYEAWIDRLRASIGERQEGHGLFPLLHVLERDGGRIGEAVGLEPGGEVREVVRRNVEYLIDVGFLPRRGGVAEGKRG
ncbi:hypothetical protein MMC11_007447 [Xylographa trunciseda]|nr:hypothetical protein [Xylographa trunciseda]